MPACGGMPEAIANAIASGSATKPTVTPETRSDTKADWSYVRSAWTDLGNQAPRSVKQDQVPLDVSDDLGPPRGGDEHVDLGAHRHRACEVDPRLDREARARNDEALVLRLEIVDVGAVPVHRGADRVPGAVEERVGVACVP